MSDSQAWNEQFSALRDGNHENAHKLAENLLELLSIDDGRHVKNGQPDPAALVADLEATVYRLLTLPAGADRNDGEQRLTNVIIRYERRKWVTKLSHGDGT